VSDLRNEILLRLGKLLLAALVGAAFYVVATALGATPGPQLALLAWISGGIAILIAQSPPF
jgi:hypothetical protein